MDCRDSLRCAVIGTRLVVHLGCGEASTAPAIGAEVRVRIALEAVCLFPAKEG
jgi:hypothetical protein